MLETFVAVCESCGKNLTIPFKARGRVLPCPRCGVTFEVPAPVLDAVPPDTVTEDSLRTSFAIPLPREERSPLAPILLDPVPVKPEIVEPDCRPPVRSRPKVTDRDIFGPVVGPDRQPPADWIPPDEVEDDDVPKRKWREIEKKTRWGTDAQPDPFSTTNPDLLRNDGWIDPHLLRLLMLIPLYGLVGVIITAVVRKLFMLHE